MTDTDKHHGPADRALHQPGQRLIRYISTIFQLDERSLAAFRILLSLMVLLDLGARLDLFEEVYSESGFVPTHVVEDVYGRDALSWSHFSLHLLHGSNEFQLALFGLAALCAVGLGLGWHTRIFAIASWLLYVSVFTRTPVYVSGSDVTLGFMLFWAMFLPLGARFSMDSLRSANRPVSLDPVSLAGGFGYIAQLWIVYTFAAYFKIATWPGGGALSDIMNIDLLVTDFGRSLTRYPMVLNAMTRFVFLLEAVGVLFLLIPWCRDLMRGICVFLFMGLHAGIALTCDIGLFPYISIVLWVPLVPTAFWLRLSRTQRQPGPPVSEHLDATGESAIAGMRSPRALFAIALSLITVAAVLFWNLGGPARRMLPSTWSVVYHYMSFTKLIQHWALFANERKLTRDGWFVIEGRLPDGTNVDILRDVTPVDWSRPPLSGPRRLPVFWRTYLAGQERGEGENLEEFARFLNERWMRSHQDQGFQSIRMIFMLEADQDPESDRTAPLVFWSRQLLPGSSGDD